MSTPPVPTPPKCPPRTRKAQYEIRYTRWKKKRVPRLRPTLH